MPLFTSPFHNPLETNTRRMCSLFTHPPGAGLERLWQRLRIPGGAISPQPPHTPPWQAQTTEAPVSSTTECSSDITQLHGVHPLILKMQLSFRIQIQQQ